MVQVSRRCESTETGPVAVSTRFLSWRAQVKTRRGGVVPAALRRMAANLRDHRHRRWTRGL